MSLSATLVLSIGPMAAKALLKTLLDDHPELKELAPDLLDWLEDQAKAEREQREAARQVEASGEISPSPPARRAGSAWRCAPGA